MPDNPQKRDLFAELSEMSVREVESQIPGTAERGTEETEESAQRSWKNTIRTISQRKTAWTKGAEDTSESLSDAFITEEKNQTAENAVKSEPDSGKSGISAGSVQTGSPDAVRTKADPDHSGIGALEKELLGANKNHVEEDAKTISSLDLERELLSVRAESSSRSEKDARPDLSGISLEFEKNNEQSTSAGNVRTDGNVLSDEDTFYADIAANDIETRGPVNEPLRGERYDPLEEERERREKKDRLIRIILFSAEKKDRLIRIILFSALMLVAGALLTYVTFIRDSGKKPADSVKSATAGTGKNDSLPSESSGTGSGGSLTDSASKETVEDISTEDLSVYLSEMPAEGTEIVSTADALYSYEQMVKDLYFLTNRYPDIIRTNIPTAPCMSSCSTECAEANTSRAFLRCGSLSITARSGRRAMCTGTTITRRFSRMSVSMFSRW